MRTTRNNLVLIFILSFLALLLTACTPPDCTPGQSSRTQGCDQFKRVNSTVYKGSADDSSLPVFSETGWHPLASGEAVSTNSSGMAELNFSGCWDGQLFCFKDSGLTFQVATCGQVTFEQDPLACVPNGSVYTNGPCPGEYSINTGSARIIKTGTVLSITYLPERRGVTLVIVLEGAAEVQPVAVENPLEFAQSANLDAGTFYFTMPDDQLSPVGGLEPRQVYPLPELPPVVEELGILDWMISVRDQASVDGVLPQDWPENLGGTGADIQPPDPGSQVFVNTGGSPFTDPLVEDALLNAVNWPETAATTREDDLQITGFVAGDPIDLLPDAPFDPGLSQKLLAEAGYPDGVPLMIFYPPDDPALARMAKMMSGFLPDGGFQGNLQEINADFDSILARLEAAGQGYVLLER